MLHFNSLVRVYHESFSSFEFVEMDSVRAGSSTHFPDFNTTLSSRSVVSAHNTTIPSEKISIPNRLILRVHQPVEINAVTPLSLINSTNSLIDCLKSLSLLAQNNKAEIGSITKRLTESSIFSISSLI